MANEFVAKQRLVTAYAGSMKDEKTPARNDPALVEYLKKVNENGRKLNGGMIALCHTREKLDSYTVAKADGLWLLFEPKIETLKKTRDKPVGKFIAVDIPAGMWSMDSGKVMFGLAPVDSIDLHVHLITHLTYIIAAEKGVTWKELAVETGDDFFSFGNGMTARVVGAGALEYTYSLDGKMLTVFIDPFLKSASFNRVPPNVLSEIMGRVNGCEGVRIEHRCI